MRKYIFILAFILTVCSMNLSGVQIASANGNESCVKEMVGDYSWALYELKEGHKMYRRAWGNWKFVKIQRPEGNGPMTLSYIYTNPAPGLLIPWTATQGDMMAEDWEVVLKCRNCGQ